jgi:ribosomal protein L31E
MKIINSKKIILFIILFLTCITINFNEISNTCKRNSNKMSSLVQKFSKRSMKFKNVRVNHELVHQLEDYVNGNTPKKLKLRLENFVDSIPGAIKDTNFRVKTMIMNTKRKLREEFFGFLKKAAAAVVGVAKGVGKAVVGVAKGVGKAVVGVAKGVGNVVVGVAKGVGNVVGGVIDAAKSVGGGVLAAGKAVLKGNLMDAAKSLGGGIVNAGKSIVKGVVAGVGAVGKGIIDGAKSVGKGLADGARSVIDGVVKGASVIKDAVVRLKESKLLSEATVTAIINNVKEVAIKKIHDVLEKKKAQNSEKLKLLQEISDDLMKIGSVALKKASEIPNKEVQELAIDIVEGLEKLKEAREAGNINVGATKKIIDEVADKISEFDEKSKKNRRFRVQSKLKSDYVKKMRALKRHLESSEEKN